MSQRSIDRQSTPARHAPPFLHTTSQNLLCAPHTIFWFAHELEPSQWILQPAAFAQLTPSMQALPPMQVMSQVWPAGQATEQFDVHEITHQPPLLQLPFAAVHVAGSQKNGPASLPGVTGASASTTASPSASTGTPLPRRVPKLQAPNATKKTAARTRRSYQDRSP
jgi:hypothetical protein